MIRTRWVTTSLALFALIGGCGDDGGEAAPPCARARAVFTQSVVVRDEVDLLLVIDNSNSMLVQQFELSAELPRLFRVLGAGDRDGDGRPEFAPVRSVHVGVVTTDMGSGGATAPTCLSGTGGAMFGDDGVLRTQGRTETPGCMASYPAIFEFVRDTTEAGAFASEVACVAVAGSGGCGYEQQLDAALKAVSPSTAQSWTRVGYEPPLFFADTRGHADGMNAGFLRPNSTLAILLLTDEDDCSALDPEIFDAGSERYASADLSMRCIAFPDALYPIERYVNGLLHLRQDSGALIFEAIVGMPVDAVGLPIAEILAHPQMAITSDPMRPTRLLPACTRDGRVGFPARRIAEVAQGLEAGGAQVALRSVCESDFAGAIDDLIASIAALGEGQCVRRPLDAGASGLVSCGLLELLPARGTVTRCADLAGRTLVATETVMGESRELCEVSQVGPAGFEAGEPGWWYERAATSPDPSSTVAAACGGDGARVRLTVAQAPGAELRLECADVPGRATDEVGVGGYCDPAVATACGSAPVRLGDTPVLLACDSVDRTCQVPCPTGDSRACSGLPGHVCDARTWAAVVGAEEEGITDRERARRISRVPDGEAGLGAPHLFCVNPSCF